MLGLVQAILVKKEVSGLQIRTNQSKVGDFFLSLRVFPSIYSRLRLKNIRNNPKMSVQVCENESRRKNCAKWQFSCESCFSGRLRKSESSDRFGRLKYTVYEKANTTFEVTFTSRNISARIAEPRSFPTQQLSSDDNSVSAQFDFAHMFIRKMRHFYWV